MSELEQRLVDALSLVRACAQSLSKSNDVEGENMLWSASALIRNALGRVQGQKSQIVEDDEDYEERLENKSREEKGK